MQQHRRDLCSKRPQTTEERTFNIPIEYESSDDDKASEGGGSADTHSRNSATDLAIASLEPGQLFEDPEFPTGPTALFFRYLLVNFSSVKRYYKIPTLTLIFFYRHCKRLESKKMGIEWKRPCEMVSEPRLYVDGTSRRDVIQGILGDCWLLSTCAAVAKREELMHKVLDPSQVLFGEGYKGYIEIKLWR